ncbi:MAG: co-chaperone Hsc20 [Bacteroidetes bacterium OLB11]|nr:MAG: co-chaperone Hsc20 [Bacteroidetes bacterium OLB11]
MDYFTLYNIPISLKVNKEQVQTKFYELSKKYHPDLSFRLEGLQHEEALNLSAEINEAKKH